MIALNGENFIKDAIALHKSHRFEPEQLEGSVLVTLNIGTLWSLQRTFGDSTKKFQVVIHLSEVKFLGKRTCTFLQWGSFHCSVEGGGGCRYEPAARESCSNL